MAGGVRLPCIQVIKGATLGGANMAVQWYCAPAMGHMDAISANEAANAMVPVRDKIMP